MEARAKKFLVDDWMTQAEINPDFLDLPSSKQYTQEMIIKTNELKISRDLESENRKSQFKRLKDRFLPPRCRDLNF